MKAATLDERPLQRAMAAACKRFNAREIRLRYRPGPRTGVWIVEALLVEWRVPEKMLADDVMAVEGLQPTEAISVTNDLLNFYNDRPVAQGRGSTIMEAIAAMAPVTWTRRR